MHHKVMTHKLLLTSHQVRKHQHLKEQDRAALYHVVVRLPTNMLQPAGRLDFILMLGFLQQSPLQLSYLQDPEVWQHQVFLLQKKHVLNLQGCFEQQRYSCLSGPACQIKTVTLDYNSLPVLNHCCISKSNQEPGWIQQQSFH